MKELDLFIKYAYLFSTYKALFSDKQKIYLENYFEKDMSFSEIATSMNVSRQATFDNISKACKKLDYYEKKLGIVAKNQYILTKLEMLKKNLSVKEIDRLIKEIKGS